MSESPDPRNDWQLLQAFREAAQAVLNDPLTQDERHKAQVQPLQFALLAATATAEWVDRWAAAAIATAQRPLLNLLASIVDLDDCRFDHHGGCQTHGYLSLEPGEICPHEATKRILAKEDIDD